MVWYTEIIAKLYQGMVWKSQLKLYLGYNLVYVDHTQTMAWLEFDMTNHSLGTVSRGDGFPFYTVCSNTKSRLHYSMFSLFL